MSRTEGFPLPRIPPSHSKLIEPSKTWTADPRSRFLHARSQSEPAYYTSYLGCPRQDVPDYVLGDATTFDETFDKVGSGWGLPQLQSAGKVNMPLSSLEYDSLHDPHVRHLYLGSRNLRRNLISRGLVTGEMKVVGSEREFREHVRAHEMFERREALRNLLDEKERERVRKMTLPKSNGRFPTRLRTSLERAEKRKEAEKNRLVRLARERDREEEASKRLEVFEREAQKEARLRRIHAAKREEERKRLMMKRIEEEEFNRKYDAKFKELPNGFEIAAWHREAEILGHRIRVRRHLGWRMKNERAGNLGEELVEDFLDVPVEVKPDETTEEVEPEEVRNLTLNLDELEKELHAVEEEEERVEMRGEDVKEEEEEEESAEGPDPENDLLQKVMLEIFSGADLDKDGCLSDEEFANVFWELNFGLSDGEIRHLLAEANSREAGAIEYGALLPRLRGILVGIFRKRDNEDKGGTAWIPLYSASLESCVFFEKASGVVATSAPEEWAPKIRDDLFADTMGDIFTSGDLNQDGYLDRDEFYELLHSPNVGLAYYTQSQADDLLAFFDANTRDGHMTFEEFLPLARAMIQLIYQNSDSNPYPWVELDSSKLGGAFWFNKFTSEVVLYPPGRVEEEESRVREITGSANQRSALPPIQEAPSDRDTLSGSVAELEIVAGRAPASANPSLERPTSPLPPPATPEVNNRPVGEEKTVRSPERRRRRRRRRRSDGGDREERRERHRSRRESRRREERRESGRSEAEEALKERIEKTEKESETIPEETKEEEEPEKTIPDKEEDEMKTVAEEEPEEVKKAIPEERKTEHEPEKDKEELEEVEKTIPEENDPVSKSEKNLADDEKINLGLTSSSSLSRPTSGKPPRPASSSAGKSVQPSIKEKPITDEEKIESRRNSRAELST